MTRTQSCACALICSAVVVGARAQRAPLDYPQWRGQHGDGAASAFIEPKSWPDILTRRWRVDVGEGYATPIVVGDAVYMFTRHGQNEGITALDAATGAARWRSDYPAPYAPSEAAKAHGASPKATPLFHQGKLFTLGISGIVAAFDAARGTILWRTEAPDKPPFFGAASSPVAVDDLVIDHPGSYGPLTAFDVNTGRIKWTAGGDAFFASPLIATVAGTAQVITVAQKDVIGVAIPDGAVLWRHPWSNQGGGPMPVLFGDDTVIVSSLNVGTAAIKVTKRDGRWETEQAWTTKEVAMYVSNPVIIGDTLYGLSHRSSGQFFALDARTGKTLWLGEPREAASTAVVKSGDLLFLLNDDAELIVARSSRTGFTPLKRYVVADSATWAQPAITGNRIFVKDTTSLTLWAVE
jgi:outer membrane protein assembly factor BamB